MECYITVGLGFFNSNTPTLNTFIREPISVGANRALLIDPHSHEPRDVADQWLPNEFALGRITARLGNTIASTS